MHRWTLVPALLVLALTAPVSAGEDAETDTAWGAGELLRVADAPITYDDLCIAMVDHLGPSLTVRGSPAHASLRFAIRARLAADECARRGLEIGDAEIETQIGVLDERIRSRSADGGGFEAALADALVSMPMARQLIADDLRLKRLSALNVSIGDLEKAARLRYGLPTAETPVADPSVAAVVVVNDVPIERHAFGALLLAKAGKARALEILDKEIRTRLAEHAGAALDEASMRAEWERLIALAPLEARFDPVPVWETEFVYGKTQTRNERGLEAFIASRHARALFGLVKRFRADVTSDDVESAWYADAPIYGAHLEAEDLEIPFQTAGDAFATGPGRTRVDALRLARRLAASVAGGLTLEAAAAQAQAEGHTDVRFHVRRLYNTDRERLLGDLARSLQDGQLSKPFETLSEVHLLRRVRLVPAPGLEEVTPLLRERLARERARLWLEHHRADESVVRFRRPFPLIR